MIETLAVVRAIRPGFFSVEPEREAACAVCNGGCAARRVSGWFSMRPRAFEIASNERYAIGERVLVTIAERSFLGAVLRGYGFPLLGLLLGAFAAAELYPAAKDGSALAGGLFGMLMASIIARRHSASGLRIARRAAVAPSFLE